MVHGSGGEGFESPVIDSQSGVAFVGEGFGEWGRFAEFVASNGGEDEPVVPVAARLLDGLEGAG